MKKIFSLLVGVMLFANTIVFASEIEIQPTMYSKTLAADRVWCGTFQLAWNDFINKIVFNPVRFREGTPASVIELNKQSFNINDISEKDCYKYSGKVRKNTKKQIAKAIKRKFKETSDILDKLDLTARGDMYLIYAMLKKDFEFVHAFDKLGKDIFAKDAFVEYFGIDRNSEKKLREGVNVLFYNNEDDFAVELLTSGEDIVYLYKNSINKPFNFIYSDMMKKQRSYNGAREFKKVDELRVPNISLSEEKSYEELTNKRIMGTNLVINQAVQSIKFNMDDRGVKLKSEAGLTAVVTSIHPEEECVPRMFYFDDTFVVFIKEKSKSNPYFALRVNDITKFQNKVF